ISTGVGAGIVIDGHVLHGAHHMAGELGHLTIDPVGPRCGCGGRGHIEAYAGGDALTSRAKDAWPAGVRADGSAAPINVKGLVEAAASGDATDAIAVAIAVLWLSIDPARLVIGGAIGIRQHWLVRHAVRKARHCLGRLASRPATPVPAALGTSAPLVGAALLALESARLRANSAPSLSRPVRTWWTQHCE
ncbi:MAG: hypothetical protein C4321_03735, partial [Chloroflexota bacterium]